jgi:hypothetical protein
MSKKTIRAIHDLELKELLINLDYLEAFENREIKCSICNKVIDEDNFGCVYSDKGEIKFSCNNLECYEIVIKRRGGI